MSVAASDLIAFQDAVRSGNPSPASSAVRPLIVAFERLIDTKNNDALNADPLIAITAALGRLAPDTPLRDEAEASLAKLLRVGDTSRRVAAATALGEFHPTSTLFTTLTGLINDSDRAVRVAALWAIDHVDFSKPFIIPKSLATALEDESADVRVGAAAALGHAGLGIDPFVPVLLRHAERDADNRVRELCCLTLHRAGENRMVTATVLPDLIRAIASPDPATRSAAFQMLSSLKAAAVPATPALVQMMKEARDQNDDSRVFHCAEVLLGIGSEEASKEAIGTLRMISEHGAGSSRATAAACASPSSTVANKPQSTGCACSAAYLAASITTPTRLTSPAGSSGPHWLARHAENGR